MTTPTPEPSPTPARRRFRITRDGILFVFGLAGIVYETVINNGDNPTLLILFGAMCGLPAFLHADELTNKRAAPKEVEPPEEQAR